MKVTRRTIVRIAICLFFLTQSVVSFSQLTFSLDGAPTQSKFIEEWQTNKTIELTGVNGSSDSIPVHFRTCLLLNDTVLLAYNHDSVGHVFLDTLFPGSNYYHLNSLLPISSALLIDTFATTYEINGELMSGEFMVIVQIIVAGTVYDSDSINFEVQPYNAPGLEGPYDNCNVYRSNTPTLLFTWNPVSPAPENSVVYHYKLFEYPIDTNGWAQVSSIELDSNSDSDTAYFDLNPVWFDTSLPQLQNIEWVAKNSPSIYEDQVTDITELFLPSHICEILYDQYALGVTRYGWIVTSYDAESGEPIGSNDGSAYPFIFNVTNSSSDTNYMQNKNGEYCPNNGFETTNIDGWRFWKGTVRTAFFQLGKDVWWKEGRVPEYHDIVSYDIDPQISNLYTTTHSTNMYSLRLEDTEFGASASKARHTFTVGPNTTNMQVSFAIVQQDHGGRRIYNPSFEINLYKSNSSFPFRKEKFINGYEGEFEEQTSPFRIYYRPWHCIDIDLSDRTDQTITIEIISMDCPGGHVGYGYVDFCASGSVAPSFTTNKTVYCLNDAITADGSASTGETDHEWLVEKCLANGTPIPGTAYSQHFDGEAGAIDIRDFYELRGGSFVCNSYYKVSLKAWTGCVYEVISSKVIEISCPPEGIAGINYCCLNKSCSTITLGHTSPPSGYSYSWTPINGSCSTCLSSTSIANPTYNPATSTSTYQDDYQLTITNLTTGCSYSE